jgi:hypothetical protein
VASTIFLDERPVVARLEHVSEQQTGVTVAAAA